MKRDEFANKIEMLPTPFTETSFYRVFSKPYYAEHQSQAEAFWSAIEKVKHSAEYAAAIRD